MIKTDYKLLNSQLHALLDGEADALAAAANFVGLLYNAIEEINWLGIYVLRGDELVLGPFQGKPACVHIALVKASAAQPRQRCRRSVLPMCTHFQGTLSAMRIRARNWSCRLCRTAN